MAIKNLDAGELSAHIALNCIEDYLCGESTLMHHNQSPLGTKGGTTAIKVVTLLPLRRVGGLLILSIALYSMVLWGFAIREKMSPEIHYLYPLTFILLFVIQVVVAYRLMKQSRILKSFQPLSILIFISVNIYLLYSISSVKRENEIGNYFLKNENSLNNIAEHFDSYGDDSRTQEMKHEMKIERIRHESQLIHRSFKQLPGMINMRLYTCAGYGYGMIYTCDAEIDQPKNLGGSPVTKWLKLKDHWFYYSIFD